MKKFFGTLLAAMLFTFGAQGFASAAANLEINVDNPKVVMLEEEEYYIDDPDAEVGDVYVNVETGEEYEVVE